MSEAEKFPRSLIGRWEGGHASGSRGSQLIAGEVTPNERFVFSVVELGNPDRSAAGEAVLVLLVDVAFGSLPWPRVQHVVPQIFISHAMVSVGCRIWWHTQSRRRRSVRIRRPSNSSSILNSPIASTEGNPPPPLPMELVSTSVVCPSTNTSSAPSANRRWSTAYVGLRWGRHKCS